MVTVGIVGKVWRVGTVVDSRASEDCVDSLDIVDSVDWVDSVNSWSVGTVETV